MHQGHNIPWSILETHFTFTYDDKRFTPPVTGLVLKKNAIPDAVSSDFKHFINKFVSTIKEFSETERKKFPAKVAPIPLDGKVFSDALRDKHPEYLNERIQPISYWIKATRDNWNCGELMDAVNVLLYENEMSTLLMLAHHPDVNMRKLHYYSWGHHFGFCRSRESAISAYMFFNTMEAVGCLSNGAYARTQTYRWLIDQTTSSMDYSGHQVTHKEFLRSCGLLGKNSEEVLVHLHYEKLQEYLKTLFAIMYRYDVLAREVGIDPEWEVNIGSTYPFLGHRLFER
jgi:hypothetical protein